ncbi:YpdA family putative bacillithiol disulfide reductase [Mangrovivirga sp. M17]|uniref:YpdA family putative bacillithiol disulfide reductase n=1 Tax=Mangrovivirga halotolerans TaxID=2993936 RepID=A0ABT3RVW9_9BACT|nr:YpdA family putative bacillithiol disulfide reductase [Mangrovivirga halotolerans]MCX2745922.1 YpdA family putative bacillithiol disulfide reductase [Mangrovivirga halotolerans]
MNSEAYDIAIIGAGPIGMACAIEAKNNGLSHVLIDKGCLVNSIYHYPYNMTFFSTSDRLEVGNIPFVSHGNKPTRAEALEYYRRVAQYFDLNSKLYESVNNIKSENSGYIINTSKSKYKAKYIIIATGFYDLPYKLNVPGEDLPKVKHYYDEPHPYYKQEIIVVGAANSAVDVALETYRKGANVTMVIREEEISPSVKYWVKPDIENRIKEGSIKAYFNSEITSISEHEVKIETGEGRSLTLENDFVLAMTGYQPDFTFLKETGVNIGDDEQRTPEYDLETMETNVKNVYLAGVICGGLKTNKWFIENSRVHASMILKNIIDKEGKEVKKLMYI